MRKYILILSFCIVASSKFNCVFSQSIDYNTIILPSDAKNIEIEERLVQLAWNNNPINRIENNNLMIARKSITLNHADWLDIIRITGNINEFTINPEAASNQNYYFPRYNFSATINLGMFISTPTKTSISKLEYENQLETIKLKKLELRGEVLKLYQSYKQSTELLKIYTNFAGEAYSNFLISEQQFKSGDISIEDYNMSFRNYNEQVIGKIERETNLINSKIELEQIIGINIDDLLNSENRK